MTELFAKYVRQLTDLTNRAVATGRGGKPVGLEDCVVVIGDACRAAHQAGKKVMFIGNGGSAAICSHMAIDFSKNGGIRSVVFTDGAAVTCLSNDLGYENVFAKQVELHGQAGDVLIAISSSGRSPNILAAADVARRGGITLVTLSGFDQRNPLRDMGEYNLYVASHEYGMVEVGHQLILHAVLDINMGWTADDAVVAAAN